MDEHAAIAALKRGEIAGLEPLVHAYQVRATRAAYLITRDAQEAQDIVQSAFVRACERIDQLRPGHPFGPWFLRSVVNDAIKSAARAKRQTSFPDAAERVPSPAELADAAPNPEQALAAAETRAELWAALAQLPPEQRATVVLRYYLDLSEEQISDQLAVPRGTTKWRLHTARSRLRGMLRAEREAGAASSTKERSQ